MSDLIDRAALPLTTIPGAATIGPVVTKEDLDATPTISCEECAHKGLCTLYLFANAHRDEGFGCSRFKGLEPAICPDCGAEGMHFCPDERRKP